MSANPATPTPALPLDYSTQQTSSFRWVILALVFFAITINYIDRQVLGLLAPDYIQPRFGINDKQYGYITATFALCYGVGQMLAGRWLDAVGIRLGYAAALFFWSIVSILHAFARGPWSFGMMRGLLGVTESPAFPAATKTFAEWFPKKERALAMGVANAGANVGAVAAPILVPWLAANFGWQSAFIVTGAIGMLWLVAWIPLYRRPAEHPRVSPAELAHIQSDPPEPPGKIRWIDLVTQRQAWGFAVGKFLTDPIWSFYLFWLPKYLKETRKLPPDQVWTRLVTIYIIADIGSIGGGWISTALIKRGWTINAARKVTLLICALCVVPSAFTTFIPNDWAAVIVMGIALAAHQGFSSNLFTLVSDTFPRKATASVAGFGGTFGYLGTTMFMALIGYVAYVTNKNYTSIFLICGWVYLIALLAIHLLMPRLEPARVGEENARGFDVLPPGANT